MIRSTFFALALTLIPTAGFAAVINNASYDATKDVVIASVTYGGGCSVHEFSLKFGGCAESYPGKVTAQLIEKTNKPDGCEALFTQEVVLSVKNIPCRPAHLTIQAGRGSAATVLVEKR